MFVDLNTYERERERERFSILNVGKTLFRAWKISLIIRQNCAPTTLEKNSFNGKERILTYMGVSLNGGTPKTPQNDHF